MLLSDDGLRMINQLDCILDIEGHATLDRNPEPGYNTLFYDSSKDNFIVHFTKLELHTLSGLFLSQARLPDNHSITCIQSREAVCTIFMVIFGMFRPEHEPTIYQMRGGHANY